MSTTFNRKQWLLLLVLGWAAVVALGGARAAHACYGCASGKDGKTAPALECQVFKSDKNHNWGYTDLGQICNYDTQDTVRVVCPLLRDRMSSTNGLSCATATLFRSGGADPGGCGLIDTNNWKCILQSKDETGLYGSWSGWMGPRTNNGAKLNFNTSQYKYGRLMQDWRYKLQNSFSAGTNYLQSGHYFLTCDLPPVGSCGGKNCVSGLKWFEN